MKFATLIFLSLMTTVSAFAGQNRFELNQKGLYVGKLKNGEACSIEVTSLEKKLITRKLVSLEAKINYRQTSTMLKLACKYDMENGKTCMAKTSKLSLWLDPKEGWTGDSYPWFIITKNEETEMCSDLRLVNSNY